MSEFLDIGGFIEQAVQEVLHEEPGAPSQVSSKKTDFAEQDFHSFRVRNRASELKVEGREQENLGLVGVAEDPAIHPEDGYIPTSSTEKNPLHTGGYGAGLWGGRQFYAQMIMKKKAL